MPSIDFTRDEIGCILGKMQMELDDWEDYHTPESAALIHSIVNKIQRYIENNKPIFLWTRWDAWREGVREAAIEDGMTWTPENHPDWMEMNEQYDRGKNFGRRALGIND